jgi:hypothetical protein
MGLYAKAEAIAPNNPRVIFSKAEFEIECQILGQDTKPMCAQIKAIELFCYFSFFLSKWGLDRALIAQKNCK